ncbi:tetratricopeptide repeat protein [Cyanobacterium stanieri LEGE 03274]|uniref:Tetratricopeptide repeat protein n=1 Tax=Cyanobacterium stanieri LEGE 03274 TaxID=1828756 RepID=A0ABR9V4I4_9CHRO|nr:tetratricopeptide repeat protein [Cyanobacterium stanieri]MBE9222798.1 tetratricopeptide repeat protein [Cyanobacterium stanieri LEGE 03274]
MFKDIVTYIDNQEYEEANKLIHQLSSEGEELLWKNYYYGLIAEKTNQIEKAEEKYRQVIKDSIFPHPQMTKNIRDGLERIKQVKTLKKETENQQREARKEKTLAEFQENKNSNDLAILALKPLTVEQKNLVGKKFAEIIKVDPYTAKLQLPTRNLRLYQTGKYGELSYYQQEFNSLNIQSICYSIKEINQTITYQVKYIINHQENITIVSQNKLAQEIQFTFNPQDIINQIRGKIPIFEMTLHTNPQGKLIRKKETLDYISFCDLHLPKDKIILRFSDYIYQFDQGIDIFNQGKTNRDKWLTLIRFLNDKIGKVKSHDDFTTFGEGAIQFPEMLTQIESNINIFRKETTLWDEAFQLYSALILLDSN